MARKYLPEGELLAAALAGRVDATEHEVRKTSADVAALGRGLADLTAQIRTLTTGGPVGTAGAVQDDDDQPAGQLDWFAVDDIETARAILTGLQDTVEAILTHHGISLDVPCWPLHPAVVVDLLALTAERDGAYTGPKPTPVSEWLTRWLPATTDRITAALATCLAEHGHRERPHLYDTTGFDPLSAAAWWARERHLTAPEAFALPRLT